MTSLESDPPDYSAYPSQPGAKHNGRCAVDREFVHIERGRRRRRPGMVARWPEGGQEGAWQHPGIAAGGNWREPGEAGAGAGQGPGFTLNPSALVPTSAEALST